MYARIDPIIVINSGNSFILRGKIGSGMKLNLSQFSIVPLTIAPIDRKIIGEVNLGVWSLIY